MYSSSSMSSHMSAISYLHKVLSAKPNSSFYYKENFQGVSIFRSYGRYTHLPITPHILRRWLNALVHTVPQYSLRILLRALFLLAFHAFLRLGEVAVKSSQKSHLVLERQDVTFDYNGPQLAAAQIIMRKHIKFPFGHIPAIYSKFPLFCTVNALFEYSIALNIQVVLTFRQLMRVQLHIQKSQLI